MLTQIVSQSSEVGRSSLWHWCVGVLPKNFRVCSSVGQSAPLIRVRPVVQVHPDPPKCLVGAIAQLGERLLCKQEVGGSIPPSSTNNSVFRLDILFFVIGPRKFRGVSLLFKNLGKSKNASAASPLRLFVHCIRYSICNQAKMLEVIWSSE